MIASEKKRDGTSDYGRLVWYLADPQHHKRKPGQRERVLHVQATNLHNDQVQEREGLRDALAEVAQLQARNHRAQERTLHLMLSFHEELGLETLQAIEQEVVAGLGYGAHQRISVVHGDTARLHIHIAINKVYRAENRRGQAVYLNRHLAFGYPKLARLATELEKRYGLLPDDHGALIWDKSAAQPTAVADLAQSLRSDWGKAIQVANDWSQALAISAQHGVTLKPTGRTGLRLVTEHGSIAAGKVGKAFTRAALEKRFGPLPLQPPETPQKQAHDAVLHYATAQAERDCNQREQALTHLMGPGPELEHWRSFAKASHASDLQTLHALRHFSDDLQRARPSDWPRLRKEQPSAAALFRRFSLAVRQALPGAARQAAEHLSQHLHEEKTRAHLPRSAQPLGQPSAHRWPRLPPLATAPSHKESVQHDHNHPLTNRRNRPGVPHAGQNTLHRLPARHLVPAPQKPPLPMHAARAGELHQRPPPQPGSDLRWPDHDQRPRLPHLPTGRSAGPNPAGLHYLRRPAERPTPHGADRLQPLSERSLVRPADGKSLRLLAPAGGELHERPPLGPYRALRRYPGEHPKSAEKAGSLSLLQTVRQAAKHDLRAANSWDQRHAAAANHGLRLLRRGRSLRFEHLKSGECFVASRISPALSLGVSERHLGPYKPGPPLPPLVQLREAVVSRALDEAARDHVRRRQTIDQWNATPQERHAWFVASGQRFQQDLALAQQLYKVGRAWEQASKHNVSAPQTLSPAERLFGAAAQRVEALEPHLAPLLPHQARPEPLQSTMSRAKPSLVGAATESAAPKSLVRRSATAAHPVAKADRTAARPQPTPDARPANIQPTQANTRRDPEPSPKRTTPRRPKR